MQRLANEDDPPPTPPLITGAQFVHIFILCTILSIVTLVYLNLLGLEIFFPAFVFEFLGVKGMLSVLLAENLSC